jgi:uncharacterized membrane protein
MRRLTVVLVSLAAALLLSWNLGGKSLFVDELFTGQLARDSLHGLVERLCQDNHPPAYFLVVRAWTQVFGDSDASMRWPSVVFALLSLLLTWRVGIRLVGPAAALAGVAVLAAMPAFLEYSRMARYYSMGMAAGLLATLLLERVLQRNRIGGWVAYALGVALVVYTFYAGVSLIVAHGVWTVWEGRRDRRILLGWIGSVAGAVVLFLPWLGVIATQQVQGVLHALPSDFSLRWSGVALACAYPLYVFGAGETLFPWHPLALPALATACVLFAVRTGAARGTSRAILAILGLLPVLLLSLGLIFIATGEPFLTAARLELFVLPYLALGIGGGIVALGRRVWAMSLVAALAVAWSAATVNYYAGRDFLNPVYVLPVREVAADIARQATARDVVVGEWDSGFTRYYQAMASPAPYFEAGQTTTLVRYLDRHSVDRVWLVTQGRDRTRQLSPTATMDCLRDRFRITGERGYVEQDATYRRWKERLLHRPAYRFKLVVQSYARSR